MKRPDQKPKQKASTNVRSATDVDRIVGLRLGLARKLRGLTQTSLGDLVGVQFQQIQKYESGGNRIPASRLYKIAKTLQLPITYFFPTDDINQQEFEDIFMSLKKLKLKDAQSVLEGLDRSDEKTRKHIVELVAIIADKKALSKGPVGIVKLKRP